MTELPATLKSSGAASPLQRPADKPHIVARSLHGSVAPAAADRPARSAAGSFPLWPGALWRDMCFAGSSEFAHYDEIVWMGRGAALPARWRPPLAWLYSRETNGVTSMYAWAKNTLSNRALTPASSSPGGGGSFCTNR